MYTSVGIIAIAGFVTGLIGMGLGMLFSNLIIKVGYRLKRGLLGIISGIMLSVVCFDLIPEAIEESNIYVVLGG